MGSGKASLSGGFDFDRARAHIEARLREMTGADVEVVSSDDEEGGEVDADDAR